MIALSKKDDDLIWEYVKQTRANYLWNISSLLLQVYSCKSFIENEDIKNNFEMLSQMLNVPDVTEEVLDISPDSLNERAKMFLYLNSCPSTLSLNLKEIFSSSDLYTVIMSKFCIQRIWKQLL